MYCCLWQDERKIWQKSSQPQRYKRVRSEFHSSRKRLMNWVNEVLNFIHEVLILDDHF
jgi:hypothetical protein